MELFYDGIPVYRDTCALAGDIEHLVEDVGGVQRAVFVDVRRQEVFTLQQVIGSAHSLFRTGVHHLENVRGVDTSVGVGVAFGVGDFLGVDGEGVVDVRGKV